MALLWGSFFNPLDLVLLIVGYLLTGIGITVGYHRLFTHRAFATKQWVRYTFAILGSMAVEGPVLAWVADHRKHHQFSDQEGDPHSPHLMEREGFAAAVKNLFHAHVGWLFVSEGRATIEKYVPFSINSICHFWGRRNFKSCDESRNVWLLSLISFGESWHSNHHAFPTSAFHGMRRFE